MKKLPTLCEDVTYSISNGLFSSSGASEHFEAGFALSIAIVAKCEEIINLAQKI